MVGLLGWGESFPDKLKLELQQILDAKLGQIEFMP